MEKRIWKQNIRNLLIILLAVTVIFTGINVTAYADEQSGTCGTNVKWTYNADTKTLSFSGSGAIPNVSYDETSGSGSNGYLAYKGTAETVVIGTGITSIGTHAFADFTAATSITLPDGLEVINEGAFYNCSSLTSIVIPESVEKIISGKTGTDKYGESYDQTFRGCSNLSKTYVLGSDTKIYVKIGDRQEQFETNHTFADTASKDQYFGYALGGGGKRTKVYCSQKATNISDFLGWATYWGYYKSYCYADITSEAGGSTVMPVVEIGETSTITAYFDGIPMVSDPTKEWSADDFTVTTSDGNTTDLVKVTAVKNPNTADSESIQPLELTITVKTEEGEQMLAGGTYTVSVADDNKAESETYTPLTLNLTVVKKTVDSDPVVMDEITISNAAQTKTINLTVPTQYGGEYSSAPDALTFADSKNYIKNVTISNGKTMNFVMDTDATKNLTGGQDATGAITLNVTNSQRYNDYTVQFPIRIKASPAVLTTNDLEITDGAIKIKNSSSKLQYACKAKGETETSFDGSDWMNGTGSELTFENLNAATTYTVAVRYKAVGTEDEEGYVAPTLPATTEVTTLQTTPKEGEGYIIVYGAETIGVQSNYEVSESIDFKTTLATNDKIEPGKTYYVRRAKTGSAPASAAVSFKLKDRPETAKLSINNSTEQITIPAGYSYKIGDDGKEIKVTEETAVTVEAGKNITWWIAATDDAFASEKKSVTAPSKGTITTPDVNYTAETVATTVTMQYSTDQTTWTDCDANMTFEDLGYGKGTADKVIYLRTSATKDNYASETVTVTLKARPEQPTAGTNYSVNYQTGKITVNAGYEIKKNGDDNWTGSLTENTTIDFEPGATYEIRKIATEAEPVGQPATIQIAGRPSAPTEGEGYSINYVNETITVDGGYEVSESKNFETTLATTGKIEPGKTYYVRKAATDALPASAAVSFKLKDRPETAILSIDKSTEQITIPAGYSYKIGNDGKEIKVTEDTAVTVPAGQNITWWIPATDDAFASVPRESIAPSRGTITTPKVDYTAETVATTVTMQYRTEETTWKNCSANMTFEDLGYGEGTTDKVIYLRTSATADNYASETVTVTLKARPKQPGEGSYTVNYSTEKITVTQGYEIKKEGESSWTGSLTGNTTIDLTPGTTYEIRKKATEEEPAGQSKTFTVAGQPSAPTESDYNVDYTKETITVDAGYEIKKEGESSWTGSLTDDTTIEFTPGAKYEIRKKSTDEVPAGATTAVTIPKRGDAPEKVATPERSKVTNNGITIDVKKGLEYLVTDSSSAPASWTGSYKPEEDGEYTFENLEAEKTYYIHVRSVAKTNEPASESSASEAIKTKEAPAPAPAEDGDIIGAITTAAEKNTTDSMSLAVKAGYEYVVSESAKAPTEEDWSNQPNYKKADKDETITINGLKSGTKYYVHVRKAGTDTAMPSGTATTGIYTRPEAPTESDYNVDYTKETITVDAGYEIKKEGESSWTGSLTEKTTIEFTPGAKYEIRKKATDEVPAGAEATVTIPARENAPEKVATPERSKVTNNGITIDVKKGLEYLVTDSSSAPASWTGSYKPEEDGEYTFENLEAEKTYYIHVRSAAKTNEPASESSASEAIKTKAAPEKAPVSNTEVIIKITDAIKNNTVNSISFGVKPGYEYVVSESANAPTEEDWSKLTNYYKEETEKTITINGLKAGTNYYIYVRKAGTDTAMPSEAAKVNTCTRPEVPKAAEAIGENKEITIDYANGKVKLTGDTYEVYVPTDGETKPDISEAGNVPKDSDMDINVSDDGEATIYIKKKGTGNVRLDSEWLEVKIKLNVTPDQVHLGKRGANQQLEARFSTQDMPYAGNITWKSSNNSVATVDDTGKVTAVGNGDAVITARIGKFEAETKVTVKIYKTSGGSNTNPKTDVITTGDDDNKITSSTTEVNIETKTDASGNKVTTAKVTVSQANSREILEQAKYYKSKEIVLNVSEDDLKDAGSLEVSLDKTFIDSILNNTDANLRIKTPATDKLLTRNELQKLSKEAKGDTVAIDLSQTDKPDKYAKLIKGVKNTSITLKSKRTKKGNVLLTWTKSKGYKVDYYEVYRSVKKNSGYGKKPFFITKNASRLKYTNTKSLKSGKTYYYKVRGVRIINGKKYYTEYSNKTARKIR